MNEKLISKDKIRNYLLVEGNDDRNVCYHLLTRHHIQVPEEVTIVDKKGIENLLQSLETELLGSEKKRLGIIVDADDNLNARWQSLRNILINFGYKTVPINPDPHGTIIKEEDYYTIGIWLMPDNQTTGMLEHFCSFLVPSNDILWATADSILQQVINLDRRFPEEHRIKAHIHTWLAWQEEPGKPMGQAITKQFLDHTAPMPNSSLIGSGDSTKYKHSKKISHSVHHTKYKSETASR